MTTATVAWSQKLQQFGLAGKPITALAITPTDYSANRERILLAGTGDSGVFMRKLDGDQDWIVMGLEGRQITCLSIYHWGVGPGEFNTPFAGVMPDSAGADSILLYQHNLEGKWIAADHGIDRTQMRRITALGGIFFSGHVAPQPLFAAGIGQIYRSMNVGGSWEAVCTGVNVNCIQVHQASRAVWVAGASENSTPWLAKSLDGGATWTPIVAGDISNNAVLSLLIHPDHPDTVYAGLGGAVIVSYDGGQNWAYTGLAGALVAFHGLTLDWRNPAHLYAGGIQSTGGFALYESFDGGLTWLEVPGLAPGSDLPGITSLVADPVDGGVFYLATANGVWRLQGRKRLPGLIRIPGDYATIQAGLVAAEYGDTLLVAAGIYYENLDFKGKAVLLISEEGAEKTIIDGGNNGSVVTFASGEDSSSQVIGFTLRNGSGTPGPAGGLYGGGIYCHDASPWLGSNIITENYILSGCGSFGGGIAIIGNSHPILEKNRVCLNSVVSLCDALVNYGGGIFMNGRCSPRILNNTISKNQADFGGGIAVQDSAGPLLQRNTISQNLRGGIWICQAAMPVIGGDEFRGNDFVDNHGVDNGQQLFRNGHGDIINAQFNYFGACPPTAREVFPLAEFNTAYCSEFCLCNYMPLEIGNFWTYRLDTPVTERIIATKIVDDQVYYQFDRYNGLPNMLVRLDENEKLILRTDSTTQVWADFAAGIGDRWQVSIPPLEWTVELQSKSDPVSVPAGIFRNCCRFHFYFSGADNDWDEWYAPGIGPVRRIHYGIAVIEYPLTGAQIHGIPVSVPEAQTTVMPAEIVLYQNYPNPFNATTLVRYDLPGPGLVTLAIYNLLGQKVATLVQEQQSAGQHQLVWQALDRYGRPLPGGIYLLRLRVGNWKDTRKILLVR